MKLLFVGISNNDCCIGDYGIGRRSRLSAEIRGVRQSEDLSCLTSLLKKKRQYRTDNGLGSTSGKFRVVKTFRDITFIISFSLFVHL